jgi:hypothetical protein
MIKVITSILFGLILFQNIIAQQQIFGYKTSEGSDIISDIFKIQDDYVLDSVYMVTFDSSKTNSYKFEYYNNGKLKRDINLISYTEYTSYGELKILPGARDYYYDKDGRIDSILYNKWDDTFNTFIPLENKRKYTYDNNARLKSIKASYKDSINLVFEYFYDGSGNLVLSTIMQALGLNYILDTTSCIIREYDSQNRIIFRKDLNLLDSSFTQNIFDYDSLGNINFLTQSSTYNGIRNDLNKYYKFDELNKLTSEIIYTNYFDSTWYQNYEIFNDYDEQGRIKKISEQRFFSYNSNGNLDTLKSYGASSSYLNNKGTFVDSYGNSLNFALSFPHNYGITNFYYKNDLTDIKENNVIKNSFTLSQNYPNPFNPTTNITYSISKQSLVKLELFDILGRKVKTLVNKYHSIGLYHYELNMSNYPSGIYVYKLSNENNSIIKKMILLK